jgi:diaminopimelate decarboxylase
MTMINDQTAKMAIFPLSAKVNDNHHLTIGGCDAVELTEEFGTPLYVFDEYTLRFKCREFKNEFVSRYPNTMVAYASKAFLNCSIANIINQEGLGLDVVSGGELSIAQSTSFPPDRVHFHGNNKTVEELKLALKFQIGRIVVDNFYEIQLLDRLCKETGVTQPILLRIAPGIDAHTHQHTTTGLIDSKFGFPLATGQAEEAIAEVTSLSNLKLIGLHCHLGSPINELSPYELAIDTMLQFLAEMQSKYHAKLTEFSPGGGFAVQYTTGTKILSTADYAESITSVLSRSTHKLGLPLLKLIIEPGRAIIAQAGIALYKVGSIKNIPGLRKYVCIDGGMGDNIRPPLYDAKYETLVANRMGSKETDKVSIAGKYCESGDILIRDTLIVPASPGDIIAMPAAGAYAIPMSSNYNMVPRPAIVMVSDGKSRLIRKRETYKDLMRLDVI